MQQHEQARRARSDAGQLRARQAAFGELLTAPDARVSTVTAGSGVGTVVWSADRNRAGFLATGLPDPGPGRVYELWLDHAGTYLPAGLLPDGDGALLLTAPLDGARSVGLTVEPMRRVGAADRRARAGPAPGADLMPGRPGWRPGTPRGCRAATRGRVRRR